MYWPFSCGKAITGAVMAILFYLAQILFPHYCCGYCLPWQLCCHLPDCFVFHTFVGLSDWSTGFRFHNNCMELSSLVFLESNTIFHNVIVYLLFLFDFLPLPLVCENFCLGLQIRAGTRPVETCRPCLHLIALKQATASQSCKRVELYRTMVKPNKGKFVVVSLNEQNRHCLPLLQPGALPMPWHISILIPNA